MQIKAQVVLHGVAQDIFIDASRDWIAVKFTTEELRILSTYTKEDCFVAAPLGQMRSNLKAVLTWAKIWPMRFFAGTHRAPEGTILLPNNQTKDQDKGS